MSKESRFTGPFDRQKLNGIKECWNMNDTTFTMFIKPLWTQWSSKKSLLLIDKTSGLFFNTLTAGQKYSLLSRNNLNQQTQMQLSLKGKTFSQLFSVVSKCRLNFEHFLRKFDPYRWCILEVTHSENRC